MTITELKEYIFENSKIEYILEQIGCHHIEYHKKGYYTCGNCDGDNKTAIIIYNDENLKCKNYTRKMNESNYDDLISLVGFNEKLSFIDSIKYIHSILGLDYKFKSKKDATLKKIDPLQIFKKFKRNKYIVNVDDIEIFDESIIKEYIPLPHILWIREGILPFTCERFKIGYSADKKRIVMPERYWCGNDEDFIGIMGRTVVENYEMFDICKYLPLKTFHKSLNLYGLQENYKSIQMVGYVVVAESQKSALKRHSRKDETVVSIGSHTISEEQVKILIGLDVEIIIAYDKGISLQHIRSECEKFYGLRNVSYMYDKYDIMKNKQAPMDLHNKTYQYLLKHRIKYDEKEHGEYINERNINNEKRV